MYTNIMDTLYQLSDNYAYNEYYYPDDTHQEYPAVFDLIELLEKQHREFISRNDREVAVEQLENRLLGYSR